MKFTISQVAQIINAEIDGNSETLLMGFSKIEESKPSDLSFLANLKYENYIYSCQAGAVLVSKDFVPKKKLQTTLLRVSDPYHSLSVLMELVKKSKVKKQHHIDASIFIPSSAKIGSNVHIGIGSIIGENVIIGEGSVIKGQAWIADNVQIGDHCTINAGVKVYEECVIGQYCTLHAGAVIGSDGFGFAPNSDGSYNEIPQLGNVFIGNHVSIGSNTCIDRATLGSTIIGDGVKIDNLVQIGHNVCIGDHTVIAAQTGIAGSTKIGKRCVIAGQVGFAGHLIIADGTKIGGQSAVTKNIVKENGSYAGRPLLPVHDYLKLLVKLKKL